MFGHQNAYDAMSPKGGSLRVKVEQARRDTRDTDAVEGIEIRITDSGPGIAPELREQIFNPFVTTKKTGVGLGLSIVSKIIDGHHGFIRIESGNPAAAQDGQGAGACFVVFFPAASSVAPAGQAHLVIS